jgi:hypothetical protein
VSDPTPVWTILAVVGFGLFLLASAALAAERRRREERP